MSTPELHAVATPPAVEAMAAAAQQRQQQMTQAKAQARFAALQASGSGDGSSGGGSASGSGDGCSGGGSGIGTKRKRVVLSIYEKQQVLQRLEHGEQPVAIARAFGISRQQVSDIKKNKARILSFCVDAKHLSTLRRKTLRATSEYHPGVEQELYRWMIRQRRLGRAVTSDALTTKATELFTQYSADDAPHVSFKSILNWMRHFKRAHGLKTFTEDEFERLADRFVPAMDMTRSLASSPSSQQQQQHVQQPTAASACTSASVDVAAVLTGDADADTTATSASSYLLATSGVAGASTTASTTGASVTVMDVSSYISAMTSASASTSASANAASPLQQETPQGSSALHAAVNTAQQLTAQLAYFEREMGLKLDYLDARVDKLCFLVLPPRFT